MKNKGVKLLCVLTVCIIMVQSFSVISAGAACSSHNYIYNGEMIKNPTCTDPGQRWKYCSGTNCTSKTKVSVAKLGHSLGKAATCTESGKCARKCGTIMQPKLGHNWISATCKAPKTCSRCKTTQGSKVGHVFHESTGKCKWCNVTL